MRIFFINILFSCFCVNFFVVSLAFSKDYKAALVADMDTGEILYQENSNDLNYPASLTKIMTLYLTFDALEHGRLSLDDYLIVSDIATKAEPVKLGLKAGSKIKVEDAIKALAVRSANDVARVLAENLKGGKEGSFASLMTNVATEIGLSKTNFQNSSGLPSDDHLSTARDIAMISMAVYKHFPKYWKYFGIKNWEYNGKKYKNTNDLLEKYSGCDGMKTGFTNKSKYSLVSSAKRGNKHIISVILGAQNKKIRSDISMKMLDIGFSKLKNNSNQKNTSNNTSVVNKPEYTVSTNNNSGGIQFGAFSNVNSAKQLQEKIFQKLGIRTNIDKSNVGIFRVRTGSLSKEEADKIQKSAKEIGIDNYIFR